MGFSVEDKTTDKMRRGIRYDDLTEEEKASFEDTFADDDSIDFTGTEIEGTKPVSYTHLDVYKRQTIPTATNTPSSWPTHLLPAAWTRKPSPKTC